MGECQEAVDAKHCVSCHNSRIIIYTAPAAPALKQAARLFEDGGQREKACESSAERC